MKFPFYSENLRIAIAENPLALTKEDNVLSCAEHQDSVLELEELKTYFVKFYDDHIPDFFSCNASGYNNSTFIQEKYPENLFEISFRNSVGMTRLGPLMVRVKNAKIPEHIYHSMLEDEQK